MYFTAEATVRRSPFQIKGEIMITSAQNTQVKNIIKLNQKAKARREQKLFVAEGRKMFLEAPAKAQESGAFFLQRPVWISRILR